MTVLPASPAEVLPQVHAAEARLRAAVERLDDAALLEPSRLPDWSRGHVVAHVTHVAEAFVAVTEAALEGRSREMYPGGRKARAEAIERDADRPSDEATERLEVAYDRLAACWDGLADGAWTRLRVPYRTGTLADLLASQWREVEIHHVDLDVGDEDTDWPPVFAGHAIDFLLPRLSDASDVTLHAVDVDRSWGPDGEVGRTVRGPVTALAAWLAGRTPSSALQVEGGDLPELGPWP